MKLSSFLFLFLSITILAAQETPTDFLSADFHKERREKVRDLIPANSVAVFFANPERNRANDVDYIYHQDPDFYYLTGYKEPNSVLLIFSEDQTSADGKVFNELVYVQEKDPRAEQWNGKRLGVEGVQEKLGFDMAFNGREFEKSNINFKGFDTVLFFDFKNDYRDLNGTADLFDLIKTFKIKTNYPSDYNATKQQIYSMITSTDVENSANVAQTLGRYLNYQEDLKSDQLLTGYVNAADNGKRKEIQEKVKLELKSNNLNSILLE